LQVILNKLDDFQLAMIILRLYESDLEDSIPSSFYQLLKVECLGFDSSMNMYDSDRASPDPFIRSMAFWLMKDYSSALATLLEVDQSSGGQSSGQDSSVDSYTSGPTSVFNFYNYLRTHPLIIRQNLAISAAAADTGQKVLLSGFSYGDSSKALVAGDKNVTYVDKITPMERRLYFKTAHAHFIAGCPALALEVLTKLPKFVVDDGSSRHSSLTPDKTVAITAVITSNTLINTGTLTVASSTNASKYDRSRALAETSSANAFDWSVPATQFVEEKLDLSFGSSESDEDDDNDGLSYKQKHETYISSITDNESEELQSQKKDESLIDRGVGDVMAHQLKFIACIKIMVDELSTLATGFEVDGGQLRYQLYIWLEKEVEVLKLLCNYGLESGTSDTNYGRGMLYVGVVCCFFPSTKLNKTICFPWH
jgi:DmX-like protein